MNDYARQVLKGEIKALGDQRKHLEGEIIRAYERIGKNEEKLVNTNNRIRSLKHVLETGRL